MISAACVTDREAQSSGHCCQLRPDAELCLVAGGGPDGACAFVFGLLEYVDARQFEGAPVGVGGGLERRAGTCCQRLRDDEPWRAEKSQSVFDRHASCEPVSDAHAYGQCPTSKTHEPSCAFLHLRPSVLPQGVWTGECACAVLTRAINRRSVGLPRSLPRRHIQADAAITCAIAGA